MPGCARCRREVQACRCRGEMRKAKVFYTLIFDGKVVGNGFLTLLPTEGGAGRTVEPHVDAVVLLELHDDR